MIPSTNFSKRSQTYIPGQMKKRQNSQYRPASSYYKNQYPSQDMNGFTWENRQNFDCNYNAYRPNIFEEQVGQRTVKHSNTYNYYMTDYQTTKNNENINKLAKSTVGLNRKKDENKIQSKGHIDISKSKNKYQAKSSKNIPLYERLKNTDYPKQSEKNNKIMHSTYDQQIGNANNLQKPMRITYQTSQLQNRYKYNKSFKRIDFETGKSINNSRSYKKIVTIVDDKYDEKGQQDDLRVTPAFGYIKQQKKQKSQKQILKQPKLSDFMLGQCKGEGRFGKVYVAVHKKTGFIFALKKIRKDSVRFMLDQFIIEIKIQQYLSHPNLVKVYGYFTDNQHFYMLVEYMEQGSLYSLMKKQNKKLSESDTAKKMHQICQGIKFMHDQNIVHRDMKPQNIVLTHGVCKVCDFGWAAICEDRRNTYCGTLDYVCPQIADGRQYDSSVDIWCLGVLAYEMMCGKAPFYDISKQKTIQNIKKCKIDTFPSHLSQKAVYFIKKILQKNPQQRVGINQLLSSQFLRTQQL